MSETTVAQNAAEMQGCRRGRRAIALVEAQADLSDPRQADATDVENGGAFGESVRAFLAPKLVRAAVEGRLPRGINIERLRDAPAEWSRQFEALGLNPQQ